MAGLTSTDDYVNEWRRVARPCAGEPQAAARAEAERLVVEYDSDRVRKLVEHGGRATEPEQDEQ